MSFRRIRAVIADADSHSRDCLRSLLEREGDVEVTHEAPHGLAAVEAVLAQAPDLVVLDVYLPKMDGFAVVQAVTEQRPPFVVLVAPDDRQALRAFEAGALDYLLKPPDVGRLRNVLGRVRRQLQNHESDLLYQSLLTCIRDPRRPAQVTRFTTRANGRVLIVRAADVDWIEAVASHIRLHVGDETYVLHETLSAMEARLDRDLFLRIHRSYIVNVERIRELHPWHGGESAVILRSGARLPLSRRCREALHERFGRPL